MIQRIALVLALMAVLDTIQGVEAWQLACLYALILAWGWICTREGFEDAMDLSQAILHKANDMLKEAKQIRHNKGYTDDASRDTPN